MTKRLEEELGLPPMETEEYTDDDEVGHYEEESTQLVESLSTAEKLDYALSTVTGVDKHDDEMDEISSKAISSYDDLVELGKNSPPAQSGRIYEVAGQLLKAALDARNSKADKKIKLMELQLKKLKMEKDAGDNSGDSGGDTLDRNELLKLLRTSDTQEDSKSSDK